MQKVNWNRNLLYFLVFNLANISAMAAELSQQMVMKYSYVTAAKISPDGKQAAYFVIRQPAEDEGKSRNYKELWVMDLEDREPFLIAAREDTVSRFDWGVDSQSLYFTKQTAKKYQLFKMDIKKNEILQITTHPAGVGRFSISRSGEKLAFISKRRPTKEERNARKNGEDWIINESDFSYQYLYLWDEVAKTARQVSPHNLHVFDFTWNSDGTKLIYQAAVSGMIDFSYMFRDLYTVSLKDGKSEKLLAHDGKMGSMAVSADGKYLAFLGGVDLSDPADGSILLHRFGTKNWVNITEGFEGSVTHIDWIYNENLVFAAETFNHTSIYKLNINTRKPELVSGKGKIFKSLHLAADGNRFVCAADDYNHPDELFLGTLQSGKLERLTDHNPDLNQVEFFKPEDFIYNARDSYEIYGIVIKPAGFKADGQNPLYVYVHGGPESARQLGWNNTYSNWPQIMAQKGCVVFMPNYRGSTGRGVEFSKADQGDMMGVDFEDVLDGIDALIDKKWVHPDKVGISGGSYGGYMTAWAATRYSDRFAAGVMRAGISNQVSKIGMTDTPHENALVHWKAYSWEQGFDLAWERSPLKYIKNHKTPLLIAHGADDERVPAGQAHELYRALNYIDQAEVRLVIYPKEKHGLTFRAHRAHHMQDAISWFEKYLLNK